MLHEIPTVAVQILEDHHGAVSLVSRRLDEAYAIGGEALVIPPEVVGTQEEHHAASTLPSNRCFLLGAACSREQECGLTRSGWRDQHPALRLIQPRVLQQTEAETVDEIRNRFVVVPDEERDVRDELLHVN